MKMDCLRGVAVVVMTPFRDHVHTGFQFSDPEGEPPRNLNRRPGGAFASNTCQGAFAGRTYPVALVRYGTSLQAM